MSVNDEMSAAEVARALDVSYSCLANWRRSGSGPPWRKERRGLGGRVWYKASEVAAWCLSNDVPIVNPFDADEAPE